MQDYKVKDTFFHNKIKKNTFMLLCEGLTYLEFVNTCQGAFIDQIE